MIKAPLEPLPSSFLLPRCIFITDAPASYAMFAEFVSVMLHLFPFKHLQASLLKQKWRGETRRKIKSMFTQLKLHSNSIWMGATNFLCTIDVLFISVNVVTVRGRIASLNKTGLWAFISGSHTQRHLRSLGMCRGKKNNSANSCYFSLSVLKGLMNKCNSAKLMKSNAGKRGMILRKLEHQITGWTELQIWNLFTDLTEAYMVLSFNNYCNLNVKNNLILI